MATPVEERAGRAADAAAMTDARPGSRTRREGRVPAPLRRAVRGLVRELRIAWRSRRGARQLRSLARTGLQVHLGCGADVKPGWVNIDLPPVAAAAPEDADTRLIGYDLRRGLPLPDDCCARIYSSHFLEHLRFEDVLALLHDCRRALEPGGVLRTAIPDFEAWLSAYVAGDASYFDLLPIEDLPDHVPGAESLIDYIQYVAHQGGEHLAIYDRRKLTRMLEIVGFRAVRIVEYDAEVDPPSAQRRRYSVYVEAVR